MCIVKALDLSSPESESYHFTSALGSLALQVLNSRSLFLCL